MWSSKPFMSGDPLQGAAWYQLPTSSLIDIFDCSTLPAAAAGADQQSLRAVVQSALDLVFPVGRRGLAGCKELF